MYADFRQFYMLQKEALKYFLSSLFASTFATKVVSTTQIFKIIRKYFGIKFSDLWNMSQKLFLAFAIVLCIQQVKNPQKNASKKKNMLFLAGSVSTTAGGGRSTWTWVWTRAWQGCWQSLAAGDHTVVDLVVFRCIWFCQFMLIMWYPGWWVLGQA